MDKQFANRYGHFSEDGREYVITTPHTPRPWSNVISNGDYALLVSQTGSGYSWRGNAGQNRITRSFQDLVRDNWGKYFYIRDLERNVFWSAAYKPVMHPYQSFEVVHGLGYSRFRQQIEDINHPDAKAANARAAATLSRLRGDAFQKIAHRLNLSQVARHGNSANG